MCAMPVAASSGRAGVTVRLAPETHERLSRLAKSQHRSVAAVLEMLVEQELSAREEAERVIRVHVAPELSGTEFGDPDRRAHETDAAYARRKRAIDTLFGRESG